MKKIILTLLLVGSTLFANDVTVSTEQNTTSSQVEVSTPKSGFTTINPIKQAAVIVATPIVVAGAILSFATSVVIATPIVIGKAIFASKKTTEQGSGEDKQ
ncbi:MAG: hypothetical protein PHE67_00620 [Campylobacterales bacterium]|nr:hypothetical protein [Campylobacterales bacterium]